MKKTLLKILFILVFMCIFNVVASAEIYSGECGDENSDITWTFDTETLTLELSGYGNMIDYNKDERIFAPWNALGRPATVVVGEGITGIGDYAMSIDLVSSWICDSVTLPSTLERIGKNAFATIRNVYIPDDSKLWLLNSDSLSCGIACSNESGSSYEETNLYIDGVLTETLYLPEKDGVFYNPWLNFTVKTVVLSETAEFNTKDLYVLNALWCLENIIVDDGNESLYSVDGVLYSKKDGSLVRFPHKKVCESYEVVPGTRSINRNAFRFCSDVKAVYLPDSVESVGDSAFYMCTDMNSIYLPETVSSIGSEAFQGCEMLREIVLPKSLKVIEKDTFANCSALESITIPETVECIKNYAFYKCSSLKQIDFPENLAEIGMCAFSGCTSLYKIKLGKNQKSLAYGVFSDCTSLTDIDFSNVTDIGRNAFNGCIKLESLYIGENIKSIGDRAFCNCYGLLKVEFAKDFNGKIGEGAFDDIHCIIYGYTGTVAQQLAISLQYNFIALDDNNGEYTHIIADGEFEGFKWSVNSNGLFILSGSGAFPEYSADENSNEAPWFKHRYEIRDAVISDGITYIAEYQFWGCVNMETIVIPESITYVAKHAFRECDSLSTVYFTGTKQLYDTIDIKTMKNGTFISSELWCKGEVGDTDGNGIIDYGDARKLLDILSGRITVPIPYGDFDGNGTVGTEDLNILFSHIKQAT